MALFGAICQSREGLIVEMVFEVLSTSRIHGIAKITTTRRKLVSVAGDFVKRTVYGREKELIGRMGKVEVVGGACCTAGDK